MLPTRELALQVADSRSSRSARIATCACLPVYGGVGYGAQVEGLEEGAHVIVGTPGRILDHIGNPAASISRSCVKILVLDEADEMLSLGFWPDMREIELPAG